MSFLIGYFIFATSVALLACLYFMLPAIQQLKISDPDDILVKNQMIAYTTMFCISWIAAPLCIFSILIPSLHDATMDHLLHDRD